MHHVELGGRARWGKTIPRNSADYDGNGHGSHLAVSVTSVGASESVDSTYSSQGTVASARFGVAKRASVVVKVLGDNGAGLLSDVIQGIAWAVEDALKLQEVLDGGSGGPAVALLAVGGGKSRALDDVVNAAVDEGVSVVVGVSYEGQIYLCLTKLTPCLRRLEATTRTLAPSHLPAPRRRSPPPHRPSPTFALPSLTSETVWTSLRRV